MVFAASPTPGTVIENQATGSFVDTSDNSNKVVESNTVSVTVTEVAGITITPVNTPTATNGSIANFDFSITNVGNDPTKFFLPKDPSSVVGGTAGTMQVVGYIPAGGSQVNLATPINIAAAGDTGALSDPTLGGNTTLGSIPAGAAIVVRVPMTVTATTGNPVSVTLGNTTGQPSANNTPYVQGANGTGSNDLYTFDNADNAVSGEASGSPANGDATGNRQEASATQTVNVAAPTPPDLTLSKTHNGNFTVGSPAAFTFTVNNTGTAATTGTITVTDTLPTGLSKGVTTAGYNTGNFSGTNGSIWKCSIDATGKIITCTSTSVIPGGGSASFDLTGIQVDSTASNPVMNTATVFGGGQTNTANDTATDSATVQTTTASCSLQSQLTNTLTVSFNAATLVSGTANTPGAVYRFSNVATGIDALVTLEVYQGTNITAATIPVNLGASITANPDATYQYKVVLVKSTTSIPIPPRDFVVTGFDIDGNSGNTVSDYAGFVNPDGYFVNSPTQMQTTLTVTGVEFTNLDTGFNDTTASMPAYAAGAFFFKTNTFTVRGGLRNANAPANRGTSFGVQASKLSSFTSLNCQTFPRTSVVIYGNVFQDTNSNKVQDGAETAYTTTGINAVLVDSNNKVIATTPIAADGSYTFDNIPSNANYTVLITTNTATVGAAPPAILLPNGWLASGENLSGAIDGTADSTINLAVNTANVAGANFGIKVAGGNLSGTVFEDPNYGGGAGRPLSTPTTSGRDGATVELYKSDGIYVSNTITSGGGKYTFSSVAPGDYFVRVVNSTVTSSRPGTGTILPVQTFRVDDSTGTPASDVNRVGGEKPSVADTGAAGAGAVLSPTTFAFTTAPTVVVPGGATVGGQAQSIAPVKVGSSAVTGIDFGYNFDTIVNTNENGQGSLRQFILNSNALGGEAALAQSGYRKDLANINQLLPTGRETSIFMVPDGDAHPGLRSGLTNQLTNGVAVISTSLVSSTVSLLQITGANSSLTNLDGSTQTINIGDLNSGQLGTGGTVGTDAIALNKIYAPEVQIVGNSGIPRGLEINNANDVVVRGISIFGFGSGAASNHGNIYVNGTSDRTIIESNAVGISATAFALPPISISGSGVLIKTDKSVTIQNNLIGFNYYRGIGSSGVSPNLTITGNEISTNNRSQSNAGGGIELTDANTLAGAITNNLITGQAATTSTEAGIEIRANTTSGTTSTLLIENNMVTQNNVGIAVSHGTNLIPPAGTTISKNVITANQRSGAVVAGIVLNASAKNIKITQNSIYNNQNLGIDLGWNGITANNGTTNATLANKDIDYPVITASTLTSGTLSVKGFVGNNPAGNMNFANATLEFFIADNNPADQNGEVILGDGRSQPHGEGKTYIGTCTADANGLFGTATQPCDLSNVPAALTDPSNITATATDAAGNTSEFSSTILALGTSISGTVFEDPNYGGGAGRPLATATTSPRGAATVELYKKSDGSFVGSTITSTTAGSTGQYIFNNVAPGDYFVRVVNSTVTSSRGTGSILPVQTFRVNNSTGTPIDDVDRVGGEKPSVADTGAATMGAVIDTTNFTFTTGAGSAAIGGQVQSIAPVKVGSSAVTGIDFGYNFDTIVNNNDSGQGSLRQFVLNSNTLPNSGLAQVGQPTGKEVSIFMIPNGSGTPGLRAGLLNQLTTTGGNSGAAVIKLLSNLTITDSNTSLDATTQTTNVGDSNGGTVGTGGTVGVDKLPLSTVPRPEVVLDFTTVPANSNAIIIMGGSTLLQGFASYGYRSTGNLATTLKGAIVVKSAVTDANAATIRQLLGGTMADGSKPSVPASTVGYTFQTEGSANISNNFLAYNSDAIEFDNTNGSKVDFSNNELAYNGPQDNNGSNGSGIYADQMETGNNVRNITLRGNLVRNSSQPNYANAQGQGLQISTGSTFITVDNNTFTDNNVYGVNASASDTTITKNIITGTKATGLGRGNGIVVYYGGGTGLRNLISQNSLYQNASLGIDLGANVAVNANDGKVSSSSANNGMDYPIITSSALSSGTLRIKGFVGSDPAGNATFAGAKLEFFVADDDGNQNGPVIINDGKAKPHGEGKTFIGDCTANNMGLFDCSFTLGSITLTNPNNITATATDAAGNTSEFGAVFSDPNILLVKRITAINGGTTTRNGDDLALYYNTTSPYDDNVPESTPFLNQPNPNQKDTTFWPTPASFLLGGLNGGNIKPHDEMEYTIYFLSTGDTTANKVEFCDRIPANQTFVPTAFNNITAGTGGLKAADRGILVSTNNNLRAYTNLADGDLARYYAPDESLPTSCGTGTNSNGAIVVNLGTIPNATAPGLPADSHGFVRFRVRIQ